MPWGKGKSVKLEDFTPAQLEQLAAAYDEMRAHLATFPLELCEIRLPELEDRDRRLAELRKLDAAGDLSVRISYAGNLYVMARGGPEIEADSYVRIFRARARTA